MDIVTIKPTNVADVANYLLNLEEPSVKKDYQDNWRQVKLRLQEVLNTYAHPEYRVGETMIDQFDRSLNHLFESTRLLTQQLTAETKLDLQIKLNSAENNY